MQLTLKLSYPFNLDVTLCCGQAFRWDKLGKWWYGVVNENVFKVRQVDACLKFENVDAKIVNNYFRFRDDLSKIYLQMGKDEHIKRAMAAFYGLRILRQDPWECLISYICATYKNIPAIKQMLSRLCRKFGNKVVFEENVFYTFPTPQKLAKSSVKELTNCGLGYRAKYVSETAKIIHENVFDLKDLRKMSYEKARKNLLNFPGVGLKVADCVLLFSAEKLEAFPVDVWIKRAIVKYYAKFFPAGFISKISDKKALTCAEYEKLSLFGRKYFGKYAGYAQEYLYYYERSQALY